MCHLSPVKCHLSPVTFHLSPVICPMSPVMCLAWLTFKAMLVKTAFLLKPLEARNEANGTDRQTTPNIATYSRNWPRGLEANSVKTDSIIFAYFLISFFLLKDKVCDAAFLISSGILTGFLRLFCINFLFGSLLLSGSSREWLRA